MKDEIKEILDNMKEWSVDGNLYFEINDEKAKLLYYYITNLQTIEREYSAILSENAELENKINNLQEENERLKKKITFNEKSRRKMQQSLMGQIEDYKTRNEKAIEYNYKLQEENEYSDYCNKKLREKITNLEYKITTLEDYKTRIDKAIEYNKKNIKSKILNDILQGSDE